MNKSIWENIKINAESTRKNIETDILIIGGGITGIQTAFFLKETNKNITLIEANKLGGIITKKTTAKISILQGYNYQEIEKNTNLQTTLNYLDSQIYGFNLMKEIIKENNIKCNIVKNNSYIFTNNQNNIKKIIKEKTILEKRNIKLKTINKLPNNYPCLYGIKYNDSYTFNPLKYMNELVNLCKDKVKFYENTRAISISKKLDYYLIKTNKNKIKAKKIIICTHYPIFINNFFIPLKTTIEKEYIISAEVDKIYKDNMLSIDDELIAIRYYEEDKKYIIFASRKDNLCDNLNHNKNITNLINKFKNHFNYNIKNTWYNYDIKSNDNLPIIGKIKNENIIIATAFNKWGMINSTLAGKIISDIINEKDNEFIDLFNPYRKLTKRKIMNSCKFTYNNIKAYIKALKKDKNVKYKIENGIEYAIYTDEKKKEHKIINKCPHMKCKLTFNKFDKTWDCPCHGSRYDIDGKIIKGPSNHSIKKQTE